MVLNSSDNSVESYHPSEKKSGSRLQNLVGKSNAKNSKTKDAIAVDQDFDDAIPIRKKTSLKKEDLLLDTHGNRKLLKKSANLCDGLNFTSKRTLPRRLSVTDDSGDDSESESTDDRKSRSKLFVPTQIQAIDLDSKSSDELDVTNFLETQNNEDKQKNDDAQA